MSYKDEVLENIEWPERFVKAILVGERGLLSVKVGGSALFPVVLVLDSNKFTGRFEKSGRIARDLKLEAFWLFSSVF